MSQSTAPPDREDENLDRLRELREQFETIAEDDGPYSKYAEEGLARLREEGMLDE